MSDFVLKLHSVFVGYEPHGKHVLEDISFSIQSGERVALLGLNGSGKTTLLCALVGLVPHEGQIFMEGIPLMKKTAAQIRRRIGFLFNVPEDQLLFPKVIEDVAFSLRSRNVDRNQAFSEAAQMLKRLGVGHLADTPLHHLSHGQKQRVALAGALVADPVLLLLDEPTAGLDPVGKRELADLLLERDSAMLVATHDLEFAMRMACRVILLEEGKLIPIEADPRAVALRWNQRSSTGQMRSNPDLLLVKKVHSGKRA